MEAQSDVNNIEEDIKTFWCSGVRWGQLPQAVARLRGLLFTLAHVAPGIPQSVLHGGTGSQFLTVDEV